jgi:hypothetical protein
MVTQRFNLGKPGKRMSIVVCIFVVVTAISFLVWPIEKDNYGACANSKACIGEFSSVPGGGWQYLSHIKQVKRATHDSNYLKSFSNTSQQATYTFAPLLVLLVSAIVGAGIASIVWLVGSKISFSKS